MENENGQPATGMDAILGDMTSNLDVGVTVPSAAPQSIDGSAQPAKNDYAPADLSQQDNQASQPVTPAQQPAPQQQQTENRIPPAALLEERRARQAAEREAQAASMQLEALNQRLRMLEQRTAQPSQPAPDIYDNPAAFVRQTVAPDLHQQKMELAQTTAATVYGEEKLNAAIAAFDAALASRTLDPVIHQRVMTSRNPFAEAIRWNEERTAQEQSALRDKFLSDPDFLKAAQERLRAAAAANPVVQGLSPQPTPAPKLSSISGIGTGGAPPSGALQDRDFMADAMASFGTRR